MSPAAAFAAFVSERVCTGEKTAAPTDNGLVVVGACERWLAVGVTGWSAMMVGTARPISARASEGKGSVEWKRSAGLGNS